MPAGVDGLKAGVRFARAGHLARITLARARAGNRFTPDMAAAFAEACEACEDDSVWVVRLDHQGADFCLGVEGEPTDFVAALARVTRPVVASIRGGAVAEGCELALAADLRVVGPRARFALPQVSRGALPRFGGTQRLPRVIGAPRALAAILLGDPVSARESVAIGLASRSSASPDRAADALATKLLARGPIALRFGKEAVRRAADLPLDDGARFEHDLYALLQTTKDRTEGVRAFLDKRKAKFRGE